MSRQDITMNPTYGEVETGDNRTSKIRYDFTFLDRLPGMDNDTYCYGEISVPFDFEKRYNSTDGIHVHIPYMASFCELRVRFRKQVVSAVPEYLINPTDNTIWFTVKRNDNTSAKLSEFRLLNKNNNYNLILEEGCLKLYSGDETDFMIKACLKQNEVFLLKAFAGNLYQYPTTGVGLVEFLHGNFENNGLAEKLKSEFESDKMIIDNAYMDSATGELILEVRELNG